jgi:hypothetical protein
MPAFAQTGNYADVNGLRMCYEVQGSGNPLFKTLPERLRLKLVEARPLKSGCVILRYQPA